MAEKVSGVFANGKIVSFNAIWGGHRFTDEEIKRLLNGEFITINYTSKRGIPSVATGRLEWQEFNGNRFFGFTPLGKIPPVWSGHTFTADELTDLQTGKTIHLTDCISRAGKHYECDLKWENNKFIPNFNNRRNNNNRSNHNNNHMPNFIPSTPDSTDDLRKIVEDNILAGNSMFGDIVDYNNNVVAKVDSNGNIMSNINTGKSFATLLGDTIEDFNNPKKTSNKANTKPTTKTTKKAIFTGAKPVNFDDEDCVELTYSDGTIIIIDELDYDDIKSDINSITIDDIIKEYAIEVSTTNGGNNELFSDNDYDDCNINADDFEF